MRSSCSGSISVPVKSRPVMVRSPEGSAERSRVYSAPASLTPPPLRKTHSATLRASQVADKAGRETRTNKNSREITYSLYRRAYSLEFLALQPQQQLGTI